MNKMFRVCNSLIVIGIFLTLWGLYLVTYKWYVKLIIIIFIVTISVGTHYLGRCLRNIYDKRKEMINNGI